MFHQKNAVITLIVIILLSKTLYSQLNINEKENKYSAWSFSVNGGISVLYPSYSNDLGSVVGYSTSFERIETKLSLRFHRRHAISINLGKDKFKREKDMYDGGYPHPVYIGTAIVDERQQWLGLSYSYYFLITKNTDFYAEIGYGANDEYDVANLRVGMAKKIINSLSFDLRLRYTALLGEMFEKKVGSQVGFDYGLTYNF